MSTQLTRREMLERSMFTTAAALAAQSALSRATFAADEPKPASSPSEQLRVAVVGCKSRGKEHYNSIAGNKKHNALITYICDVDENVGQKACDEIEKKQGARPKYVADMRRVFDQSDVDCITTATPNHWHALTAIWALQAGKDVYVEKPVSHNVSEGRRIVEVARKYKKICQTGTQSRSNKGMRDAMAYVHDGKIGEITVARGLCYKPRGSIGAR
ncbi:MAG: Gfo/Idh/MocA family oxidoreductase [Pirellulales bacterium]